MKRFIRLNNNHILIVCILLLIYLTVAQIRMVARLHETQARLSWLEPIIPERLYDNFRPPETNTTTKTVPAEFELLLEDHSYIRPYYGPELHTLSAPQPDWCYVPRLTLINRHRLFLFAGGGSYFADLVGILGIKNCHPHFSRDNCWYLLLIQGQVEDIYWQGRNLMVVAHPQARGYQLLAVKKRSSLPPPAWLVDSNHQVWEAAYR